MSDLDDELLGLLDDQPAKKKKSSKKFKKSSSSAPAESKKRKRAAKDAGGGSDMDLSDGSSDAEPPPRHQRGQSDDIVVDPPSDDEVWVNPYVLDGKFLDQEDKNKLMDMSELDRESILDSRQAEVEKVRDRLQVRQMAKQLSNQRNGQREDASKRSSRAVKATGITETKSKGLEKLKQTREKKKRRAERGSDSEESIGGKRRAFSSDEESEEGEVSSSDERKRGKKGKKRVEKEPVGQEDLRKICLPRRRLAEFWPKPWFAEYVKGAWVRFSVGPDETKEIQYRLCEVVGIASEARAPYQLERHKTDILLEIRHGKDKKVARMDLVSNSEFTQKEYSRLTNTMTNLGLAMPSKETALKKAEEIEKRKGETLTEADTQLILAKKGVNPKIQNPILYKATLTSRIDAARAAGDADLLAELEKEMADLTGSARPSAPVSGATTPTKTGAASPMPTPEKGANMSTLNARNKKLNREEIRRAEVAAQELRKKQAMDGSVKVDPSARVRTTVRVMHDVRTATPDAVDKAAAALNADTTTVPAALKQASRIEDIAGSMDLDLGDF